MSGGQGNCNLHDNSASEEGEIEEDCWDDKDSHALPSEWGMVPKELAAPAAASIGGEAGSTEDVAEVRELKVWRREARCWNWEI